MITEFIDFITAIAPLTIAVILLAKFCLCLFLAFEYQYTRNKDSETRKFGTSFKIIRQINNFYENRLFPGIG